MKIYIDEYVTLVNVEVTWLQKMFRLAFLCLETHFCNPFRHVGCNTGKHGGRV